MAEFQYALPPDPRLANYWQGGFNMNPRPQNTAQPQPMLGTPAMYYPQQPSMQDLVYGATAGTMLGGLGTAANMGNQIGNAFDISNLLSSGNMRAQYAPRYDYMGTVDTNRTNERMQQAQLGQQQNILAGILPHIISALGGLGGGVGGIRTDYGAGFGSPAQPTNTQQFRRNPLLAALGG